MDPDTSQDPLPSTPRRVRPLPVPTHSQQQSLDFDQPSSSAAHGVSTHTPTPSRLERLSRTLSTLISPSSVRSSASYSAVSVEDEEDYNNPFRQDMSSTAVDLGARSPSSPNLATSAERVSRRRSWGLGPHPSSGSDPPWDPLQAHMDPGLPQSDDPFAASYLPPSSQHNSHPYDSFPAHSGGHSTISSSHPSSASYDDADSLHRINSTTGVIDPENNPITPNERRRTLRYSISPSPLRKTGTVIQSVGRNLRRVSLRVVNLHNDNDAAYGRMANQGDEQVESEEADETWTNNHTSGPLRGRTLGFLGPQNSLRLFLYRIIHHEWTELTILIAIIVNAVVLTIQASHTLTLASEDDSPEEFRGYFQSWEDWVLFALFIGYTIEAVARISISGLLLDPEIPISALFASPFRSRPVLQPLSSATQAGPVGTGSVGISGGHARRSVTSIGGGRQSVMPQVEPPRLARRQATDSSTFDYNSSQTSLRPGHTDGSDLSPAKGPLSRGLSLGARMETLARNVKEPFALRTASESEAAGTDSTMMDEKTIAHSRLPSGNGYPPTSEKTNAITGKKGPLQLPFALSLAQAQSKTERNVPYLRQSWGRIDLVAILGFWTSFALSMLGLERGNQRHIGIFRAMSVLRCGRLLGITGGTTTIMHSLKTARPLLASVAYFVLFAMILFSIIGIQTFSGSLRRSCYLQPTLGEDEIQIEGDSPQTCGGYIDPGTLQVVGYLNSDGATVSKGKGYICPLGQLCKEDQNPESDVQSFDTIYQAVLQVVIIASANGWTPLMYTMMDSEFFISAFFFIICVIVLNFWLINLFVAVITNTFSLIRNETNKSAFGAENLKAIADEDEDEDADKSHPLQRRRSRTKNPVRTFYKYTEWAWVLLALASLGLQATRDADISETHEDILYWGELIITIAFDVEILIRIAASLPEWRPWFLRARNILDLGLCVATTIIQIPVIRNSEVYPWFTAFQLLRFYRVILIVPRMKPLLLAVFGNLYGLINMTLFLLLVNYLAALVGVQLLRGDMANDSTINFGQIFNAFLGVYQVFSSENWTDILYGATGAEIELSQTPIVAIYISAWMLFANFIVLQMFIAVINENFDVAEEAKRSQQAQSFWAAQQQTSRGSTWLKKLNPYRWVRANPVTVKVENMPANLVLPMKKSLVQDLYNERNNPLDPPSRSTSPIPPPIAKIPTMASLASAFPDKPSRKPSLHGKHFRDRSLTMMQRIFATENRSDDVPLGPLRHPRNDSVTDPFEDETERQLELLTAVNHGGEGMLPEDMADAIIERRAQRADFIRDHPTYDKVLWIFSQKNPIRKFCQLFVEPPGGERIFGTPPNPYCHSGLSLFLLCAVIAGIVVESIATPAYRVKFYQDYGAVRGTWFDMAEVSLGIILVLEFMVKVMADGFIFTPNAYLKSIWNVIDAVILGGLLVNVITGLIFVGGLSRLTRSLKALRALRVVTLIEKMRNTFQDLIISGARRIIDAAILAILYMIPYAVWGLNIFAGKMNECNDTSEDVTGISDCINEYTNTVYGESFGFPVPRAWADPSPSTVFSFDTFRSSLLILFEIVSLEGWIDVMGIATSITGRGQQPQTNASQANSIFFLLYHLMGGVVILTLFVSIIIGNFSSKTGSAFLTKSQREWIDLQKLFRRQRPSKRPQVVPTFPFRRWCFQRATQKRGWWWRGMTFIFLLHIVLLMSQTFASQKLVDDVRSSLFLAISGIYSIDVIVRLIGLGLASFRADGWNLFDFFVAGGATLTTLTVRSGGEVYVVAQLQKLFLVAIAFKLVQRTNSLNKLFKTAVASLSSLLSLLALWLILFIFFAIMLMEVFGLTKWGSGENRNQNYSSVGKALVMLAFMTTGEGWNQYMHDYAVVYPRCTNSGRKNAASDCGSVEWAFTLFIAWNVLSMYIFVNMFTGVVVENFSYVFQSSGVRSISREEMRAFKKVWATFANPKTGYLERHNFVRFFSKLSGVFEVKIYPTEYQVPNVLRACQEQPVYGRMVDGVDLSKLTRIVNSVDLNMIRKRRAVYERLYHEANMTHKKGLGISFTDMLMLLAHHKLIVDKEALVLKDLVLRTQKTKLVTDLVNLNRVECMILTIHHRRKFLAHLEQKRAHERSTSVDRRNIPSIVVDATPATPPYTSRDISTGWDSASLPGSPTPAASYFSTPDVSLQQSGPGLRRSHADYRRSSYADLSVYGSMDLGNRSRDSTMSVEDPQNVLDSMQNSMWGELMQEAEEEESRR